MIATPSLRPLALTLGDPAGIGPEITLKAWRALRESGPVFALIGDPDALNPVWRAFGAQAAVEINSLDEAEAVFPTALPVLPTAQSLSAPLIPGEADPAHGALVRASIESAVALCLSGEAGGLVTNPIAKSVMYAAGFDFPGHTEFLADLTAGAPFDDPRGPVMMLAGGGLRAALVTIHMPLKQAVETLDADAIARTARVVDAALKRDFGIARPRLALAGLNPHAGEAGALGGEEIELINPVAARLRRAGIEISDAHPPDTMFHAEARAGYDAAICLYHDQGLIPVKTLDFHGGVNITLGLPLIRTSPDHGTAFDIAGQGLARPDSLIAALRQGAEMAAQRSALGEKA